MDTRFKKGIVPWNKDRKLLPVRSKNCAFCGAYFEMNPQYSIKQWEAQTLCSLACRNETFVSGNKRKKNSFRNIARKLVVSKIGRKLNGKEIVHHIDENPGNNNIDNLFVFRNTAAHSRWHHFFRRHNLKGLLTSNIASLQGAS